MREVDVWITLADEGAKTMALISYVMIGVPLFWLFLQLY